RSDRYASVHLGGKLRAKGLLGFSDIKELLAPPSLRRWGFRPTLGFPKLRHLSNESDPRGWLRALRLRDLSTHRSHRPAREDGDIRTNANCAAVSQEDSRCLKRSSRITTSRSTPRNLTIRLPSSST